MERMKRTRGVIRLAVTRTLNVLTVLLRGTDPDFTDLQVHLDFLLQKEAQLKELDNEIKELVDDEHLENEVVGTLEYNMNISHTLEITSPAIHPKYQTTVQPSVTGVKFLPEQEVWPTYPLAKHHAPSPSRSYRYPRFWDHFRATIHDNVELPRIEKFKYLQTYLTGQAKQAIEWVRLSDEGYDLAIKALLERFGRSSLLRAARRVKEGFSGLHLTHHKRTEGEHALQAPSTVFRRFLPSRLHRSHRSPGHAHSVPASDTNCRTAIPTYLPTRNETD
ncbi:hypothetical protein HPB47_018364 [Ixodes persulcatus]|uniref:Uncharacterized protein n=1 Tax=Ixodes persulcatus TaxID=34615 RepID=A0AC60QKX0_IXOPE|nr:hypothetical protein HPB47_018364 [Ixodes persulcatus]